MKLHVDRDLLVEHLANIVPISGSTRPTGETENILSCVLLQAGSGALHLFGTDTLIAYGGSAEANVTKYGAIAVDAEKLLKIAKGMPEPVIGLTLKKERLELSSGGAKLTIAGRDAGEFPVQPAVFDGPKVLVAEGDLRRLVDQTAYAVSDNDTRYGLNGLFLLERGGRLEGRSTDGNRATIASAPFKGELHIPPLQLVPRNALKLVRRLLDRDHDEIEVQFTDNAVRLQRADRFFWFRLIEGDAPDLLAVLPDKAVAEVRVDRARLLAASERGRLIDRMRLHTGRLAFTLDEIRLEATSQGDTYEETVPCTATGDKMEVGVSLAYLSQALQPLCSDTITIKLAGPLSPILIKDDEGALAVVMPIRLS